jgi:TetR/AcrR family transcriptional regulator
MGAVNARRYDPEGTRAAIMEAARRIFVERGVAAVALSEIAEASGVTKSLIHHHFGSKENLWHAVKEQALEGFFGGLLAIIRSDVDHLQALRLTIRHMFRFLQEHPDVARMMTWMRLEQAEVCVDLEGQVNAEGMARLVAAQRAGAIRADLEPASIMATFVLLTTGWFQHQHLVEKWRHGGVHDLRAIEERYLEDVERLFMEGVLPRPAP